ncbi:MAG TPA: T9SS type A sorting domain-containing protein, partial [Flavobacteriaceae bacterium]|nr:T9SS type A sorting domain-containing protein [Flavobacteriaceae bacterium]
DCEDMSTLGVEVGCANAADEGLLELEGLTPGATYYVKVGGFNQEEGEFCIEVQMDETPVCLAPTEIEIGEISDETVEVSWTAGGDETQWEVIYDEAGFNPEIEGESVVVNTTAITLTDLSPETDYEVYVRAICTNLNSDLAGPEMFTTEPMSVDSQVFADFTYYPNPVKDQLILKSGSQIESVEVYNLLGQNLISAQPNSLEAQIDTEKLQSGVYLMNVTLNGSQKTFRVVKK